MVRIISLKNPYVVFGIPLIMFAGLVILFSRIPLSDNALLSHALTVDLIITIPGIYFLLIRRTAIKNLTAIPAILLGTAIATFLIPTGHQHYLAIFRNYGLPALELLFLIALFLQVRSAIAQFKIQNNQSLDFYDALLSTCERIAPSRFARILATEISMFYYGFLNWKSPDYQQNEFTYHRASGSSALIGALIMIVLAEAVGMHFLINLWNPLVAWILTLLSIYSALQLFGLVRSLPKRPISLEKDHIALKYGIWKAVNIPYALIEQIEVSNKDLTKTKDIKALSPLHDLEGHNIILRTSETVQINGVLGLDTTAKILLINIDDPKSFQSLVVSNMQNEQAG